MTRTRQIALLIFLTLLYCVGLFSQTAVQLGAGSYASSIPSHETEFWSGDVINVKEWTSSLPLYVLPETKGPYPTNEWWSALLFHNNVKTSYNLWAQPLNVTVEPDGVSLHYADTWSNLVGAFNETMYIESPEGVKVTSTGFTPIDQRVKSWGDYNVQFRVSESDTKYMDVTIGHGMPFMWLELKGLGDAVIPAKEAIFFNDQNQNINLPFTGDHIGLTWKGRNYGIFAPDGSTFTYINNNIQVAFAGNSTFLVIAALPQASDLPFYHQYAYAVPRNTSVSWIYNKEAGNLTTNWNVVTQPLKGTETSIIQGWIPHHYNNTQRDFTFTGHEYVTARGKMKCAVGNQFQITYKFNGALSQLPIAEENIGTNKFSADRLSDYITDFSFWDWPFNSETYAGGKQVGKFARYLPLAKSMNHPNAAVIEDKLRGELENFFTYTPGEQSKYFAYSDNLTGLLGFDCGFGSHRFNDHHFHYGYYVYAYSILSLYDKRFMDNYKDMAKMVAKEFANWDRNDKQLPFMRTLDIWEGHSWACGGFDNSNVFGENQESTSEAMMSWGAMVQLGNVLEDDDILSAAVFGYVSESAAVNEYWFDRSNQNLPASFGPEGKISCITWSNQIQYVTYFGAEPIFVHGIQYLPVLPSSYYLVKDFNAAQTEFNFMLSNSSNPLYSRFPNRDTWDVEWSSEVMNYASMFNPDWSIDWFEELLANKDPKANNQWESGLTYNTINANKQLGRISWSHHVNTANSSVFYNSDNQQYTYCAFNQTNQKKAFTVYENETPIGYFYVNANSFGTSHTLLAGIPPSVSVETPKMDVNFAIGSNVYISAKASDLDGTIAGVKFRINNQLVNATLANGIYSYTYTNIQENAYHVSAIATDNAGIVNESAMVNFTVGNIPPDVFFTNPKNNSVFFSGDNIAISASASDKDGTVSKVDFYINNSLMFSDNIAPYSFDTNSLQAGTYSITAKTTDNEKKETASEPISLEVKNVCYGLDPSSNHDYSYSIKSGKPLQTIVFYPESKIATSQFVDMIYSINNISKGGVQMKKQTDGSFSVSFQAGAGDVVKWHHVYQMPLIGQRVGDDISYVVGDVCKSGYNVKPVVNAGGDKVFTISNASIELKGAAYDLDGTIMSYTWEQISGPFAATMSGKESETLSLTDLNIGTYIFRLSALDNSGNVGFDEVSVTVNPQGNILPIANAGADVAITLPINFLVINGSGTDGDGAVTSYKWQQISGNSSIQISTENTSVLHLGNLVAGNYIFELTVTDNANSSSSDRVEILVNAEKILCSGQATKYSYTINSEDNNPVITYTPKVGYETFQYVQVCYLVNWNHSAILPCYRIDNAPFSWQVVANKGDVLSFQFTSDIYAPSAVSELTIGAACGNVVVNQNPTANAGQDIVLTANEMSTEIQGSGSDSDNNTPLTYSWSQVSGPNQATLIGNNAALSAQNLTDGIYVFRLKVTDQLGAFATDDVAVKKSAATGLVSNLMMSDITLFPNPAKDILNVKSSNVIQKYTIVDLTGQIIKSDNVASTDFTVNVSDLSGAVYVIHFVTSNGTASYHFIKQ